MVGIEVTAVDSKKALHEFVELPFSIYRNDSNWVPPLRIAVKELLDREKHPFYANAEAEFFLARESGKVVGRVAAIIDRNHNRFHEENAGFFGFFESVDNVEVARALLGRARQWTFERGARFLRGPVNPSTNYECGMLVDGFDSSPMVMMTYNPRYYPGLMDQVGLTKAKDLLAYVSNANTIEMKKIDRVAEKVLKTTGVRVRPINMKDFQNDVERVWEVYKLAWMRNWGFIWLLSIGVGATGAVYPISLNRLRRRRDSVDGNLGEVVAQPRGGFDSRTVESPLARSFRLGGSRARRGRSSLPAGRIRGGS